MDTDKLLELLIGMISTSAKFSQESLERVAVRSQNALNVIEDVLILQGGGQGDDPGLLMALQAAAGVPTQGGRLNPDSSNS